MEVKSIENNQEQRETFLKQMLQEAVEKELYSRLELGALSRFLLGLVHTILSLYVIGALLFFLFLILPIIITAYLFLFYYSKKYSESMDDALTRLRDSYFTLYHSCRNSR